MRSPEEIFAAARARPTTHRVHVLYSDGKRHEQDCKSIGAADIERAFWQGRHGLPFIDRVTGKTRRIVDVQVVRL